MVSWQKTFFRIWYLKFFILYKKNYNLPIIFSIGLIVILLIILKINASIVYNKLQHNH